VSDMIRVTIPGTPFPQPRARSTRAGITYTPAAARDWKGTAQHHMLVARGEQPILTGPVELHIAAIFPLPQSKWRVTSIVPRQPHTGKRDVDNIAKAVMDAGNGVLWHDDGQVYRLTVEKWIGAQGEAARTEIIVTGHEKNACDRARQSDYTR